MDPGQSQASQLALEARARGTLAMDWLMADLDQLAATSLPDTFQLQLKTQLQAVNQLTSEVRGGAGAGQGGGCCEPLSTTDAHPAVYG